MVSVCLFKKLVTDYDLVPAGHLLCPDAKVRRAKRSTTIAACCVVVPSKAKLSPTRHPAKEGEQARRRV